MPIINITQADLMKTKVVEPGIYEIEVVKVHAPSAASGGKSINYPIDFELLNTNGKQITTYFNSTLIGKIGPLIESCMGQKLDPGSFDTDLLLHKKCDGKVGTRLYEGNLLNEITDFYPLGKGKEMNQVPFG